MTRRLGGWAHSPLHPAAVGSFAGQGPQVGRTQSCEQHLELCQLCLLMLEEQTIELTIHGLSLRIIVSLILGQKVHEVGFGVLAASDFILVIDEVTYHESACCLERYSDVLTPIL